MNIKLIVKKTPMPATAAQSGDFVEIECDGMTIARGYTLDEAINAAEELLARVVD